MRILLIEDDEALCKAIAYHLKRESYEVDICHDGGDGLRWAAQGAYDLILLDRMLPTVNGMRILQDLRRQEFSTPVLMVTALDGIGDRVEGLDAGADDYLVKPFAIEELLARVRSLCRRPPEIKNIRRIPYGGLILDLDLHELSGNGTTYPLSKRETQLLEIFMRNPNQVLTRELLFNRVWGPDAPVENGNLDNYIHFLRRRLKELGGQNEIKTVHGVGYRFEPVGTEKRKAGHHAP